jgi:hypothetical protein
LKKERSGGKCRNQQRCFSPVIHHVAVESGFFPICGFLFPIHAQGFSMKQNAKSSK